MRATYESPIPVVSLLECDPTSIQTSPHPTSLSRLEPDTTTTNRIRQPSTRRSAVASRGGAEAGFRHRRGRRSQQQPLPAARCCAGKMGCTPSIDGAGRSGSYLPASKFFRTVRSRRRIIGGGVRAAPRPTWQLLRGDTTCEGLTDSVDLDQNGLEREIHIRPVFRARLDECLGGTGNMRVLDAPLASSCKSMGIERYQLLDPYY